MTESLWSNDIVEELNLSETPKMLLKEQASVLARLTKQIVQADVTTTMENDGFIHCFEVIAPALNYSTTVAFCIFQPLQNQFPLTIYKGIGVLEVDNKCDNIDEFKSCLSNIFKSSAMVYLIKNIIQQST